MPTPKETLPLPQNEALEHIQYEKACCDVEVETKTALVSINKTPETRRALLYAQLKRDALAKKEKQMLNKS